VIQIKANASNVFRIANVINLHTYPTVITVFVVNVLQMLIVLLNRRDQNVKQRLAILIRESACFVLLAVIALLLLILFAKMVLV